MSSGLAAFTRELARRHGDSPALIVAAESSEQRVLGFEELDRLASLLAGSLSARGLGRGDRLALWLPNVPEWLVLHLAAARLGAAVVAINTRFRTEELRHLLATSRPRAIAYAPDFLGIDFPGMLAAALAQGNTDGLELVITIGEGGAVDGIEAVELGRLLEEGATAPRVDDDDDRPDDLSIMFPTSGTTSLPKLAAHDQGSIVAHAENVARRFELAPGDVLLCPLPLCGVFGFSAFTAALSAGATVLTQGVFDGPTSAALAAEHGATHFIGTDPMLDALVEAGQPRTLRRGICSVLGRDPAELLLAAEERLGVRMSDVYGSSECYALVAFWSPDEPLELRARKGGPPVSPAVELRIVDIADGRILGPDEEGELQIRGTNVLVEYFNNPSATTRAVTADGWYRTGDLSSLDDAGRLTFISRLDDSLRLHGFLVNPGEIEAHLGEHPAVRLAQVVGIKDEHGNDQPVAFVQLVLGSESSPSELRDFCRGRFASFKLPEHIWLVQDFPRTTGTNGAKIQRNVLRERARVLVSSEDTPELIESWAVSAADETAPA